MSNKSYGSPKVIIFDFDLTLVDTSPVEALRKARKWGAVMARTSQLKVYDGITELLKELHKRDYKIAIATHSPDMVPRAFIKQFQWPIDVVVGYHQVKNRKPDPECLLVAMEMAGGSPEYTFHVGDQPHDTAASRAAKIIAIGAGWGIADTEDLAGSKPDHIFLSVPELKAFFLRQG